MGEQLNARLPLMTDEELQSTVMELERDVAATQVGTELHSELEAALAATMAEVARRGA